MPDVRIDYQAVGKKFFNSPSNEGDPTFIEAVRNVSLNVQEGEVVSLIGPSGCGKSTLLNMGSGLYQPTEGQVFLDGELVKGPSPDVGFMSIILLTIVGIIAYAVVVIVEKRVLHYMPKADYHTI